MLVKKKLISINISTGSYEGFLKNILNLAKASKPSYICVANVHMLIEAYDDSFFANCVNNADIVTPDGMPLAKSLRVLYGLNQDRVAGMDLLPDLLHLAENEKLPVYFYGGTTELQEKTKIYIGKKFPHLVCKGFDSPPFRALTEQERKNTVDNINSSGAKIVFVALGCPKQEKWMSEHSNFINVCLIGIGGALPVLIGDQKRAPVWMQKMSLEWLYRFILEPRRLFKRYFYTNSKFILLLFMYSLKKKFSFLRLL
jgi:N-acetylglucosaminyldiphosphoundecaprenol N-acetyl-beta-D-mannosaminyltransferase